MTYSELRKKIAIANANFDKMSTPNTNKLQELETEESSLKELIDKYKIFINSIFNSKWGGFWKQKYTPSDQPGTGKYYLTGGFVVTRGDVHRVGLKKITDKSSQVTMWKDAYDSVSDFEKQLKEYNESHNNMFSGFDCPYFLTFGDVIGTTTFMTEKYSEVKNHQQYLETFLKDMCGDGLGDEFSNYCLEVLNAWATKKGNARLAFYFENGRVGDIFKIGAKLYGRQNEITKLKNSIKETVNEELTNNKISLVGFDYSIGNMYRMVFAHMETFVDAFYNMLKEAYSEGEKRSLSALGKSVSDTDVPLN